MSNTSAMKSYASVITLKARTLWREEEWGGRILDSSS